MESGKYGATRVPKRGCARGRRHTSLNSSEVLSSVGCRTSQHCDIRILRGRKPSIELQLDHRKFAAFGLYECSSVVVVCFRSDCLRLEGLTLL